MTTVRYNEAQINLMSKNKDFKMFTASVNDKFGDLGIISVIILKIVKKQLFIDTLLMSCRAIGKDVENLIINFIIDYRNKNFPNYELVGIYAKTKRQTGENYEL